MSEEQSENESKEPSGSKPDKKKPEVTHTQWWRASEQGRKPHELLDTAVKQAEDDQQGRYEAYREYERLFGSSVGANGDESFRAIASDDLSQNELQNTIETLWAQIFKNKIVPGVSVSEADWDEWDRAKNYSRWLEGALDDANVYEEAYPQAGAFMLIHGTGPIRVGWEETGEKTAKIKAWAVNPRYLTVDRLEAKHGRPRNLYQKDHIDRWQLFDTYKEEREDFFGTVEERLTGIQKVTSNDDNELGYGNTTRCDMVTVREAWHLPSGANAKDGRHVIWIRGCTLVDEEFNWDTFPFIWMRFGIRMEGFWGESAVKRLAPTQKLLDKLNKKIDESQDVMGVPRILIGNDCKLVLEHIDDIPGGIIKVEGNINNIKDWNAQCVTGELYQDRDSAPQKMRSLLGVSDFEADQQIPQGMRDVSGAMLERWVDQGQARHAMSHAEYENSVPKLSYLFMMQAEQCQEMGYDVVTAGPADSHNKSSIEELSFKEVHIDRKRLRLRVQPMSQLPQTFAGKVEAFEKLKQAGYALDQKTALRMIEIPDLQGQSDLLVSDEEIIFKNLSHMCRTGEYMAPMPFDNLDLIVQMTTRYINRYRIRKDADYQKVGLLAQYIDDAIALKKGLGGPDGAAPPSTMGSLGMGGPPGMPPPMGPDGLPMGPLPGLPSPMGPPQMDPMGNPMGPPAPMPMPPPAMV